MRLFCFVRRYLASGFSIFVLPTAWLGCEDADSSVAPPSTGGTTASGGASTGGAAAGSGASPAQGGSGGTAAAAAADDAVGCGFGEAYLKADATVGAFPQELTVEVWFRLDGYADEVVEPFVTALGAPVETVVPGLEVRAELQVGNYWGRLGCSILVVGTSETTAATLPVDPNWVGEWHHLACTRNDERLTMWLDGYERVYAPDPWPIPDVEVALVGATHEDWGWSPMQGEIAEVHVAGAVLFTSQFEPRRRTEALPGSTILWRLGDDCVGASVPDLAGGDHPATWTPLPSP